MIYKVCKHCKWLWPLMNHHKALNLQSLRNPSEVIQYSSWWCVYSSNYFHFSFQGALELSLDGTYKMRYHFVRRNSKRETYAFRIKTFQRDAILFYARGLPHLPDFMLIEIKSSRLHIVLNVGDFDERGMHSFFASIFISAFDHQTQQARTNVK